ncbi:hypothetical protein BO99DRAFT_327456 [Aspergillus violaceofuscus CBS 115571]|uniref:Zn(2)-C6 fungal-type domain-containing protein n=1 Tax=Aspergillus violaceofuscus (strain CBS 115571) TaxID=1450538 RepID=A0A2V5HH23_ASPV1|nr:hypothetical protein BO99DRAFT_327456 [Aspergillus violaceofuscus CBS 115571]
MILSPWTAIKTGKRKRPGRAAQACDACFARKIQCDLQKPRCNWCDHRKQPCTFRRVSSKRREQENDRGSAPLRASVPRRLASSSTAPPPVQIQAQALNVEVFPLGLHQQLTERCLGNICAFNGKPALSQSSRDWLKSCTGRNSCLDRLLLGVQGRQPCLASKKKDPLRPDLPDLRLLREELEQYQSLAYGIIFPILDPSLWQSTIDAAYYGKASPGSPVAIAARACLLAFHGLATLVIPQHPTPSSPETSPWSTTDYFHEAYSLLPEVLNEMVTLDGLQAILLLGLAGDIYTVDYLLSLAVRFVFHLKGQLAPATVWEIPSALHYHARHLFWITYVCDKGFSLVSGLVPRMEESHCDLEMSHSRPSGGGRFQAEDESKMSHLHGDPIIGSYLERYVTLATVQSRIYRDLYNPAALRLSDAELLERIRTLDCALEDWRQSLPRRNRPSLVVTTPISGATRSRLAESVDMRTSVFHLQYHYSMIMIHQASSRCPVWNQNQGADGRGGSSLEISVAASRALLGSFLYSSFELDSRNLIFTLSYFVQASVVIFCHILSYFANALAPNSQNDNLRLLEDISALLLRCVRTSDPVCYTTKIKFAGELIGELPRLVHCAIAQAPSSATAHGSSVT